MRTSRPEFLLLALDLGSSSTRTAFFDQTGRCLSSTAANRKYSVRYGADGAAELDPLDLLRAAETCLRRTRRARENSSLRKIPIVATCGCGFWHSLLGLDANENPITPIWMWADSRSISDARILREKFSETEIQRRTGCMLRPSFWPAKLRRLRRTQPRVFSRVAQFVSPADWIFGKLFDTVQTSHSMASATGIYNLRERSWDRELCEFCEINESRLPKIGDNDREIFLPIGDGAASNLGCGADRRGVVAINLGTSAAVRTIETSPAKKLPAGLFRFAVDATLTILGGAVSNAGNLRAWCEAELKISRHASWSRAEAASNSLTVLPFWVNERAPTWPDGMRGAVLGVTAATRADEIERAAMTSVFYRLAQILERIESVAGRSHEIIVSGGLLQSADTLPLLADSLGRDVRTASESEASIRGAAIYALQELGFEPRKIPFGKIVKDNPRFAAQHRERRGRQIALEDLLAANPQLR